MVTIKNDRLFILEKEGNWIEFPKRVNHMHRDCLEDYADRRNVEFRNVESIVNSVKCAVFYNIDDSMLVGYLPDKITDEQSYQLDALSLLALDNVNHIEVRKLNKEKEEFSLTDDVAERFSTEVIQSYYTKIEDKKLK